MNDDNTPHLFGRVLADLFEPIPGVRIDPSTPCCIDCRAAGRGALKCWKPRCVCHARREKS